MNAQSLAIALTIAVSASFTAAAQAADIITLPTVQVLPSADQLAQVERERDRHIPTLPAVEVRPDIAQYVELGAGQWVSHASTAISARISQRIITLPAVIVRPDAQTLAELAAEAIGQIVEVK